MVTKNTPESLIYEVSDGMPIYYRGYKDVLEKKQKNYSILVSKKLSGLRLKAKK